MGDHGLLPLVLALVVLAATGAPAHAAPALVAVDDPTPSLEQGDDDDWSGALSLTNLTTESVTLSGAPPSGCELELSRAAVGAAQSAEIELTLTGSCAKAGEEAALQVTAGAGGDEQVVSVTAELEDTAADPDWGHLLAFFLALPLAAVLLMWATAGKSQTVLRYLPATYDFKESWVSNITVVAGLLTGLVGSSEVIKALFGEEADDRIALATVGSAIALAFVGAAPVVLMAMRKPCEFEDGEWGQYFTRSGLVLAMSLAVAGAAGQLWVGFQTGKALDLGAAEPFLGVGLAAAAVLLLVYAFRTGRATMEAGTRKPKPEKEKAETLLTQRLTAREDVPNESIPAIVDEFSSYRTYGTSRGDDPPRRRAAMF